MFNWGQVENEKLQLFMLFIIEGSGMGQNILKGPKKSPNIVLQTII